MKKTSRRQFLARTAAASGALAMPGVAHAQDDKPQTITGQAKRVIFLTMRGGMSPYETLDVTEQSVSQGGPKAIATTAPAIQISEWLPQLAGQMDKCSLVRTLSSNYNVTHSEYYLRTSQQWRASMRHPCMGSWVSHFLHRAGETKHWNFRLGADAAAQEAWFEPRHAPVVIREPVPELPRLQALAKDETLARRQLLQDLNQDFRAEAGDLIRTKAYEMHFELMDAGIEAVLDLSTANPLDLQRYGITKFGRCCLLARRLAEFGVPFTEIIMEGWEAQRSYFNQTRLQCSILDKGFSALLEDLQKHNLLADTLVILATHTTRSRHLDPETGRRMFGPENFSALFAGGGIRGGEILDARSVKLPEINYALGQALNLPTDEVVFNESKRPFRMARDAKGEILPLFG